MFFTGESLYDADDEASSDSESETDQMSVGDMPMVVYCVHCSEDVVSTRIYYIRRSLVCY